MQFQNLTFLYISLTLLLAAIIINFLLRNKKEKKIATLKFSNATFIEANNNIFKNIAEIPNILRVGSIILVLLALAGPYLVNNNEKVFSEGIDIAITLDISASMDTPDLSPSRLFKARSSIENFINTRKNDRIALVLFGKDAYLQCPLTLDHSMLLYFLKLNGIEETIRQNTAIGTAISTAIISLKDANEKRNKTAENESKIIILVTDGDNTSGEIDPITAAKLAESYNIKIYTIGIGKKKRKLTQNNQNFFATPSPAFDAQFNEEMLQEISSITGGKYFHVQNNQQMEATYKQIDAIEKVELEANALLSTKKIHGQFILWAFFLLTLELLLRFSVLKIFPVSSIRN